MKRGQTWAQGLGALGLAALALWAWPLVQDLHGGASAEPRPASALPAEPAGSDALVARGAYLAAAGHCAGCHTAPGGAAYAGGRGIDTPFGTVYASNLTPDAATGLGRWSAEDFWQALHHGRSRDGRLLWPAFPYPNYTLVTRDDAQALYRYLRSLPPVAQAQRPHTLRFPYNSQLALAVWRRLYFRPGTFEPQPQREAHWNRGAYLVRGLGHCAACHSARNLLGATAPDGPLDGGWMDRQGWYAPSLLNSAEAGVAQWAQQDIVDLLQTGRSARASTLGPMAEVVMGSTGHLAPDDLAAMATYLQALPQQAAPVASVPVRNATQLQLGAELYRQHCAACHGPEGQGAEGAYPPLAGRRAVTMAAPQNLLRILLQGGYLPATAGNPRPYGMPPFGAVLNDEQLAAVASYIRQSWGNEAAAVSALQVQSAR